MRRILEVLPWRALPQDLAPFSEKADGEPGPPEPVMVVPFPEFIFSIEDLVDLDDDGSDL